MAITSNQLDLLCLQGCQLPGCNHDDHSQLYLHARCHIRSSLSMDYSDEILSISCYECYDEICRIHVKDLKEVPQNSCHPFAGLYAYYKLLSNELTIECGDCHKFIQKIKVLRL